MNVCEYLLWRIHTTLLLIEQKVHCYVCSLETVVIVVSGAFV
jgi:hypothetical protein